MVLARTPATLQSAGVSTRKADYLHSLARAFASGELAPSFLAAASDDELVAALTKIHGIGRWSAEMFLMFGLKRIDVFSVGDLGIQRGMAAWQGRNVKALKKAGDGARPKKWKYMTEKEMLQLAEPFKPYRSMSIPNLLTGRSAELTASRGGIIQHCSAGTCGAARGPISTRWGTRRSRRKSKYST